VRRLYLFLSSRRREDLKEHVLIPLFPLAQGHKREEGVRALLPLQLGKDDAWSSLPFLPEFQRWMRELVCKEFTAPLRFKRNRDLSADPPLSLTLIQKKKDSSLPFPSPPLFTLR